MPRSNATFSNEHLQCIGENKKKITFFSSENRHFHRRKNRSIMLCCVNIIMMSITGTVISAFAALCGAPTIIKTKVNAFLLNLLSAFLQMITFLVIVGWVWSILWGMNMVQMARKFHILSHNKETPEM